MGSKPAVCMVCILFGIICDVRLVFSQPKLIPRKINETPEITKLDGDILKVIDQIHSLSDGKTRSFGVPSTGEGINLNAYYSILNNLYGLFQPLIRDRFIEDLPKTLVCILSGRQDCGLEADLTRTVSLELGQPLLALLSSLRTKTCTPLTTKEEASGSFGTYLRMGKTVNAALDGFQQKAINTLSSLSLSENLMTAASGFLDTAAKYVSKLMATILQVPMDYIRIALQFGIQVPSLDKENTCTQGDLKQLIMWGIKNNVSWSFGMSLVDILLENLLPSEQSSYIYPGSECQNPPFQRSASETENYTDVNYEIVCDHRNLATLNDTLCADILMGSGSGSSASVFTFCQALSSLNPNQIEQVWSNMCYIIQALISPFAVKSSDCNVEDMQPFPVFTPLNESLPLSAASYREAREASSLRQLACNYSGWLEGSTVDAVLVSLCSDNERVDFVRNVCNNALLMRKLLIDQMNRWLYGYCVKSSADHGYMVSQFCVYQQWINQPAVPVEPSLLEFCLNLDRPKLSKLICEHTGFLMLLISNPENWHFMPNCTNSPPSSPFSEMDSLQLESCRYSEWHDVMQINTDILSKCILFDQSGFTREVCSNKTFLNSLLLKNENFWLETHCETSLILPPPEPTKPFNLAVWCDYNTWEARQVDDSIVGLCWEYDQAAFQENVCCKTPVFEKLLQNPQNKWLTRVCTDMDEITVMPQMCRYSDWTRPIIVDMTELALCAEIDALNFTSKVCSNKTILQNLLANQDNTWLIQHCANYSNSGISPGEGGGGLSGFIPAEQCQYNSWIVSPPDARLLTLCWERDQAKFVSSICPNTGLLLSLSREPSSVWVSSMCSTYTNYTTFPKNSTTTESVVCVANSLVKQFSWICPTYVISDCQPCTTQNMVLQMIVRCWAESLRSKSKDMLTTPVTMVLDQAVSTTVVALLVVEDVQGPSWHVTDTIRQSVLRSVVDYFKMVNDPEKKRVLLQCFGSVLSSLLHTTREVTSDELVLIKEYFMLPLSSLRPVLTAAHISTARLILQYYSRIKDTLQLSAQYLSTMVSVLLHTHLATDEKLFPELAPMLAAASPADIQALPPLQNNTNIKETINRYLGSMSLEQREAFGLWYSKVLSPFNITKGHQSLIRDTGNLIAYLPFQSFQHLSAAQLLDGLDILQRNTLTSLKQEFVANTIIGTYRNLTAQDFVRLGNLTCLADPEELLVYTNTEAFRVIQGSIMNCTLKGLSLPSQLVSKVLLNSSELQVPSSLSADRLAELAPFLPSLGIVFLQNLTSSQLLAALPAISSVLFTPTQASIIVDKLSSSSSLIPGQVEAFGSLIVGLKTETLLTFTSDRLLSSLRALTKHTQVLCKPLPNKQVLCPPEANAIATKLWGFPEVVNWLNDVEPLLDCTPLLSVLPRTRLLVNKLSNTATKHWNTQQAKAIFSELGDTNPNLIKQDFLSLGTLGQGVSCTVLKEHFQANSSPSSVRKILAFLRKQPGLLHTSLKKCVIEELYQFKFFSELLEDFGAEIALSMPVSIIKRFPVDMMDTLRKMILENPRHFLMLSRTKQELLVDKMAQRMGMYTGVFTEEEFRSLGIMAPFVVDEVFIQVDRLFFTENLDFLKGLCYSSSKMDIVAGILQEPAVFGSVKNWNQTTLMQVGRFLFFLPVNTLQEISVALLTVGRIEKLFMKHYQWERGDTGILCSDRDERKTLFEKQQFVLQFFLGFLKMNPLSLTPVVPTCEILHTTAPSVWTSSSLTSMPSSAFSNCLELMGLDPFLASYQRSEVLKRVKKSVITQLGEIATEFSLEELSILRLTERRSIGALGAVSAWNSRQLGALFTTVLNSTKQSPSQLDSGILVALGYIVCGAKTTEIRSFNNVEFSKAVLWLGQLRLPCSEEQLLALVGLLTHSLAFGPMSSWGTDVFIEIGVLAAGLPDIAMSALVKEQIEGITPLAISMITPEKFAVAFDQRQISMFSYEQAVAVTGGQLSALTDLQKQALAMVLTPWEDRPVDFRGRSLGLALSHSPLCLTLGLLMLLTVMFCPNT